MVVKEGVHFGSKQKRHMAGWGHAERERVSLSLCVCVCCGEDMWGV